MAGGAGTSLWGGYLSDLDLNTEVHGPNWYGDPVTQGKAHEMLTDTHVQRAVDGVTSTLLAAKWDFRPGGPSDEDKEAADFCRFTFLECLPFSVVLGRIAEDYIRDGFSMSEVTDDVRPIPTSRFPRHPGNGLGVVVTGIHERPGRTIHQWHQSKRDPTKLSGVTQWISGSDGEKPRLQHIPARQLFRFTWKQTGATYVGRSCLRPAYGPWKVKRMLQVIDAMAHERHGLGVPLVTLSEDATEDERDQIASILRDLRAHEKGYVILPHGYSLEWSTVKGSLSTNINQAIERCNFDISHAFAAGFMLLGNKGTSGSYALASTQEGQFEIAMDRHARFLEDTFNLGADGHSFVERATRLNYPTAAVPRLVARNMPTRNWAKILPIAHQLTQSGHITPDDVTEAHMRDVMYLPEHDADTARKPQPAPAGLQDEAEETGDAQDGEEIS